MYQFKASLEEKDTQKVYQLMDPAKEERMFNRWEQVYQWVHPIDWFESSFVFNMRVRQIYELRTATTEAAKGAVSSHGQAKQVGERIPGTNTFVISGLPSAGDEGSMKD